MPIKPIPQTIITGSDPSANLLLNREGDAASTRIAAGTAGAVTANVVNVTNVNTTITKINNPGGADGDVQYNVGGRSFGGEDAFKYDPATDTLTIAGNVVAGAFKYANGAPIGGSGGNATYANTAGNATFATQAAMANVAMTAQSVAGANVTGTVGNAAVANFAHSVNGANVTMPLANVTVSGTTNLGNAANLRIGGGASGQILTALSNGAVVWATPTGGGGGPSLATDITFEADGNITATNVQDALVELDSDITVLKGNVATLTTDLTGKVSKTGDTMTGGLIINNGNVAAPSLRVRNGNVVFADQFAGNAFVFDISGQVMTINQAGGTATLRGAEIFANRYDNANGNVLIGSTGMGGGKVRLRDGDGNPSEPVEDDNAITKRYLDNRLGNIHEITNTDDTDLFKVGVGTDGVVTMDTSRGSLEFGALPEPGSTQHFHIMRPAGQESATDLFFGDDFNYVKLPAADSGNLTTQLGVEVGTGSGPSSHTWRFGTDGTTSFPGYTFPAADGTSGQTLVTDGDGILSWATPSAGTSNQWAASIDTATADSEAGDRVFQVNGVRYDSDGNIVAIARHAFGGPGIGYASIVKLDSLGRVLWRNKLSDTYLIDGWSVEIDSNNDVFMVGTHENETATNAILVKYNGVNGDGIWGKSLGSDRGTYGFDIAIGPDDNPVISGRDMEATGNTFELMVAKFDGSTGDNLWNKTMGTTIADENAYGVAVNPANNEVTVVGYNTGASAGLSITKFSSTGAPVWQKTLPYASAATGTDVVVDADGSAYISGYFSGSSNPGSAILTLKIDSDGDVVWIREALGGCEDVGISIALGSDNDLYLCGTTGTLVEGDPVYRSIIVRYNATTGVPVWQRKINHADDWTFNYNFDGNFGPGSMIDVRGNYIVVAGGMVTIDPVTGPIFETNRGYVTQLSNDNTLPTMGVFTVVTSTIGGSLTSGTTSDTTFTIVDDALTVEEDEPNLEPGTVTVTVSYETPDYVAKSGDTMTGPLTLSGDPTADLHAATKAYVDAAVGATTPPYRGFKAHYGRMFIDEPTISKLVIYREGASAPTSIIDTNTSDDLFEVSGLSGSDFVALINVYGTSISTPLTLDSLMTFFEAVVDNVILDDEGEINPIAVIKTNFYDNFADLSAVAGDLYPNFQFGPSFFPNLTTVVALPNEAASGFLVNLRRAGNGAAIADSYNNPGANYIVGDTVTVAGTQFPGGASPANDIILTITAVGLGGEVSGYTVASGTIPASWPTNSIDDGGDDQYDTGNYISTNLAADISYNGGDVVADSEAQFGEGSSYVVTYNDSIFGIFATNVTITSIKTDGNSGFDGDGSADTGSLFGATQTAAQLINGAQSFILNSDGSVKMSNGPLLSGDGDTGLKFGFSTGGYVEDNKYFQVRPGGDNYDHIHLDTGSSSNFDLFLGDDIRYVKNARNGNIYISTNHDTGVTWTFDQNGNLTLPSNSANINHANGTSILNNVVTRESGSWTLVDGENNVSFTVPGPGTYSMWVNGNIPNGICVWNATVTVTNTNVPAIGSQYAWYYEPEGALEGQLVLTAIPDQIVGTAGIISTSTYAGATSSEFEFTITNNSGSNQVVEWGYIKL
jgi:hypothetical protein